MIEGEGPYAGRVTIDDVAPRDLAPHDHTLDHTLTQHTDDLGRGPAGGRPAVDQDIVWLSTQDAARRLGVTPRTLYRFIDEGQLPAYRFGRVIRLQRDEVDDFIERCRIQPGSLEHLYPESVHAGGGSSDE